MNFNMKRSISVIVPTYNRAHLISEAIDSILAQDIANCDLEIIVVDDGSTDTTFELAKQMGAVHPVRALRLSRNFGKEAALMAGLDYARLGAVLFMAGWSDEIRAMVVSSVLSLIVSGATGFWLGTSFGSQKKTDMLAERR